MLTELTLSKSPPEAPSLRYDDMYQAGLEHIQRLSGKIWTDYNVHDPGVTILELLCYAITDLGYRASYPIEDLLAAKEDPAAAMRKQFRSALEIMPVKPVTVQDYRKLLIDIEGIRNAWLFPSPLTYYSDCRKGSIRHRPAGTENEKEIAVGGIYDVLLEFDEPLPEGSTGAGLIKAARGTLHRHRNLCEDFATVTTVDRQEFIICAELALRPDADATAVHARLFFELQRYLTPPVRFYSLEEMLDMEDMTTDRIFEGPVLQNGFIPDGELESSGLREEIRLSDIINIIMDIDGVKAVKEIIVNYAGTPLPPETKWVLEVAPRHQPVISYDGSRVVYYKDVVPVLPDKAAGKVAFRDLLREAFEKNEALTTADLPVPVGRYRDTGEYFSFQNHFPKVYGLSHTGLPPSASLSRRARARQLKAYLLFFDQVLANYLAQLAHVRELFSADEGIGRTYFTQVVSSFGGAEEVYTDFPGAGELLQELYEDPDAFHTRRNRFVDHLLARFAERFNEYVWITSSVFGESSRADEISSKLRFLNDYPAISSGRFTAPDYTDPENTWDTDNVSGLERRVARLLGVRNYERRNLAAIDFEVYHEKDDDDKLEFRFRVIDEKSGKILLSGSTNYPDENEAVKEMREALERAMYRSGYELKTTVDGRFYFNITDVSGEVVARRIEYFESEAAREAAIVHLIDYLFDKYSDEGLFLVEHLLLRPGKNEDDFLPICPCNDCDDCPDSDPYSFRVSVVLPATSHRFLNMDFRRYAEQVIRMETPAHILPKICWIDQEQMAVFEARYRDFLEMKAGIKKEQPRKVLRDLIEILSHLKNVYPTATIEGCGQGEDRDLFVLGQNSLGTLK